MDTPILTFRELNDRIEQLPDHPSLLIAPQLRQRWGYGLCLGGAVCALLGGKLLPATRFTEYFVAFMVAVELIGLLMTFASPRQWRLPGFAKERGDYADQLDFDMAKFGKLIDELSEQPREKLDAMATFVEDRHDNLKERLPLLSGGMEKLGALPIVVALYVQFKDAHWPPHPSWVEIILVMMLLGLYWMSLQLLSVRFRAKLYGSLLRQAANKALPMQATGTPNV